METRCIEGRIQIELGNIRPDPNLRYFKNGEPRLRTGVRLEMAAAVLDAQLSDLRKTMLTEIAAEILLEEEDPSWPNDPSS